MFLKPLERRTRLSESSIEDPSSSHTLFWVYAGLLVGAGYSLYANLAYAFIPPRSAPPSWPIGKPWDPAHYSPPPGALLLSAAWPILLFITTEVMFWKGWSKGWQWSTVRCVSMILVAAPVANASYHHLSGLYRHFFPDDRLTVWFGPLAIDGATLMCTAALQSRAQRLRAEHAASTVIQASPEAFNGEGASPPGESGGEAALTDTSPAGLVGEMTPPPAVGPSRPPFTGEADGQLLASPPCSPVSGSTVTGEAADGSGEPSGEPLAPTGEPAWPPEVPEQGEQEKPSDEEITAEARRLRPDGPYSGNWLVKTFGIGTPRATRLLNQLVPELIAETSTMLADEPGELASGALELQLP